MAQDIEAVRRDIAEMYGKLEEGDLYALLEVAPDAAPEEVTRAYRGLAKKWHIDRYSKMDLGEDRKKVQAIFEGINNAHRTLTDHERRARYDLERDGGEAADVGAILEAETYFVRGKGMLKSGKYKGAHEQFKRAHELTPEDWQMEAHLLYTEYLVMPKDEKGRAVGNRSRVEQIRDRFKELFEEHEKSDALALFLGATHLGLGDDRQARAMFQEALYHNKNNVDAQRQMRLLQMRKDRADNKGFFAKLMEKFKGG